MWMTSLVMAPLWLASGSVGTAYEAGLRAELRTRTGEIRAAELELVPGLGLEHTHESLTLALRYAPRLRLTLQPGAALQAPNLLHAAALEGSWQVDTRTQLRGLQQVSYGVNEFDPLASPLLDGGMELEPRPLAPVRRYVSSDSGLALTRALSLRTRLTLGARYLVSGSLEPEERSALPLQHGPTLEARLAHDLTRRDLLETVASATRTTFSSEEQALTAAATQGWRRQLTRSLDSQLAVGAAALRATSPVAPDARTRVLPVAEAGLGYEPELRDSPFSARLAARYAPFIDRITAGVYGRAEAELGLAWTLAPSLQLASRAGVARALDGSAGANSQVANVEASATYAQGPGLALSAGVRGAWDERSIGTGERTRRFEAGAFLTLTLLAREVL